MADSERIEINGGRFTREELEKIFDAMPVEITFVDRNDRVAYFNQPRDRIFARAKAAIGRKVQECHPQKSIAAVNQILDEFRAGKRDTADFWLNMAGRLVYIRYFAVRGPENEYLGCLEVTQDITTLKKIEGEKRLP